MEFLSVSFLILFTLCFILCYALKGRYRNALLLVVSAVFIGWYHLPFLLIAVATALYTFFMAQWIERRYAQKKQVKGIYITSIVGLIVGWLFFHYSSATVGLVHSLLPFTNPTSLKDSIIIPLGMSFYIFQAIGYLTDVYWQEQRAERNPVDFMLFMLFFMKFLSGPIERGSTLLGQLKTPKPFEYASVVSGLKLIFRGLFKKLLIANQIAPHTAIMFGSIHELSGLQLLVTCLIYPIELYADFSGYTDMAIGGARMFGIELSPNFNNPFASRSTSELWRRWHMSLSFWVHDYLYIPLTAATRGWRQWGVFFSLIVTFVALGMWHGAGWSFALYGLIQGLIICWEMKVPFVHQNLHKVVGRHGAAVLLVIRTYLLFAVSLIFFRLRSISDVFYYLRNISFEIHNSWKELNIGMKDQTCIIVGFALLLLIINSNSKMTKLLEVQPAWVRWSVYYLLAFALLTLGKFGTDSFIYLQF